MHGVRADAPWCPWNIEFIRRINGLATSQDVRDIVFAARYLVLGLGDVYLGAPVATPLDPRHRLVTTKYNPARTWTRGERRRHRRRVPVHLRHGGTGRLPVRRAHDAGVEPVPPRRPVRRAALGAALLRPDRVVPGQRRGTARPARGNRGRARAGGRDSGRVRLRRVHAVPRGERGFHRGVPRRAVGGLRRREGPLAGQRRAGQDPVRRGRARGPLPASAAWAPPAAAWARRCASPPGRPR